MWKDRTQARDCYSRKSENQTLQQKHTKIDKETTIQFSQFAVHTTTDTLPNDTRGELQSEDDSGTDSGTEEYENDENSEHEICDVDFTSTNDLRSSASEETNSWRNHYNNQSSDVTNSGTRTERLQLFSTQGEKPPMDTESKRQEKSNGNNESPSDWLKNENDWQIEWPAPSWGKPKAESSSTTSEWGNQGNNIDKNRTDTRKDKTTSPSNLEYRHTTCQICETPLVTKIHQNGPLTCLRCRTWISADNFEANETAEEDNG